MIAPLFDSIMFLANTDVSKLNRFEMIVNKTNSECLIFENKAKDNDDTAIVRTPSKYSSSSEIVKTV